MQRRWIGILGVTSALVLIAACGRVNLEDLTPEAVKTQQAEALITQTAQAEEFGDILGDASRGRIVYDTWCLNCHSELAGGVGPEIIGNLYPWTEWEEFFRTGEKADGSATHEANGRVITYPENQLTDDDFLNLLAYLAQAS
jgi:cytochrome c5